MTKNLMREKSEAPRAGGSSDAILAAFRNADDISSNFSGISLSRSDGCRKLVFAAAQLTQVDALFFRVVFINLTLLSALFGCFALISPWHTGSFLNRQDDVGNCARELTAILLGADHPALLGSFF